MEMTPLVFAVGKGQAAIVNFLLENRADIEAEDRLGRTWFSLAIKNNQWDIFEKLLGATE